MPQRVVHFEVIGKDPTRLREYFGELFGWVRGIGVRIKDDILVTKEGCENLSAAIPRTSRDVEAWIARIQKN